MKHCIYIFTLLVIACNNHKEKSIILKGETIDSSVSSTDQDKSHENAICWTGSINGKTSVFIHYQIDGNIIAGEITYLNTKEKNPIKLLGTIEPDKSYRLLEFDKTGNITGIITGIPASNEFKGNWFSPKTRKEFSLEVKRKDTLISSNSIQPGISDIFGDYHYQYSASGYQGDFNLTKLNNDAVSFSILSVTGEPGRNIAEIPTDTVTLTNNEFIYKVPGTDSCEFKVKFYKDFLYVNYTKGYCHGQFGNNAAVDGLYLKTKK